MTHSDNKFRKPQRPKRGPGGKMMPVQKAKDFKGTVRKLLKTMSDYKLSLCLVFVCAIASAAFSIVGPKVLGNATTELFSGLMGKISGTGGIDFAKIATILTTVLIIYLVSAGFGLIQSWTMAGISTKVSYKFRKDISEKINKVPMKYFEGGSIGDVLSRITNDVDTLGQSLNQSLTQLVTSITTIIGVIVMMLTISPLMTLICVMILPVSLAFISIIVKKSQKHFKDQQAFLGKVNGMVEETFAGHNIVKGFNKEEDVCKEFEKTNDRLYAAGWKSQFLSGIMQPVMQFISDLGYVVIAIAGAALAIKGKIRVGDIQAFIQYVKNFTQPIMQLAQVFNMLQSMVAAAERVFEFLEEEEEKEEEDGPMADISNIKGAVEFKDVCFGYDEGKEVIHNFSCKVNPGETVAIVGPTGAGKTTLVKLLMRFYDINKGSIMLDGRDIREYRRSDLRQEFGMVLQDVWLFKGTIKDNIRYGRLEATDEEVYSAADAAYVDHFIKTLPKGYDMELNEEINNVSQGQKQLLTIARAILANHRILILDEATSSVDTRTETKIQKAMDNLMKGRTSFVIAHRLSTIREADKILVVNEGNIVEQGTHEELLERGGYYSELYNSQFEDAEEGLM